MVDKTKDEFVEEWKDHCYSELSKHEDWDKEEVEKGLEYFYEDYLEEMLEKEDDFYQALQRALEIYEEGYLSLDDWSLNLNHEDELESVEVTFLTGFGGPNIFHRVKVKDDEYEILETVNTWKGKSFNDYENHALSVGDILYLEYNASKIHELGYFKLER